MSYLDIGNPHTEDDSVEVPCPKGCLHGLVPTVIDEEELDYELCPNCNGEGVVHVSKKKLKRDELYNRREDRIQNNDI